MSSLIAIVTFGSRFATWLLTHLTILNDSKTGIEAHARGQRLVKASDLRYFIEDQREQYCRAREALKLETLPGGVHGETVNAHSKSTSS